MKCKPNIAYFQRNEESLISMVICNGERHNINQQAIKTH